MNNIAKFAIEMGFKAGLDSIGEFFDLGDYTVRTETSKDGPVLGVYHKYDCEFHYQHKSLYEIIDAIDGHRWRVGKYKATVSLIKKDSDK